MRTQHILIADDEPGLRRSLMLILSGEGFDVSLAEDGQKALDMLNDFHRDDVPVDLLVTDIQMPRMTGLELIDRLEAADWAPPVLVITGYGDKETVVDLLRKGCKEFIDKPFGPDEVLRRIRDLLAREEDRKISEEIEARRIARGDANGSPPLEEYRRRYEEQAASFDPSKSKREDFSIPDPAGANPPMVLRSRPVAGLGGDFALLCNTDKGCDVLVADVSAHDVNAAHLALMVKAFFEYNCETGASPEILFNALNRQFLGLEDADAMVTAAFLRIDLENGVGETLTAGNHMPMRLPADGDEPEPLSSEGPPLGVFDEPRFSAAAFPLRPGDIIMLYSDGLTEASFLDIETGVKVKLSTEGLYDLVSAHQSHELEDLADSVWKDVLRFCSGKPEDDMLLLATSIPPRKTPSEA